MDTGKAISRRDAHARAILGVDLHARLSQTKLLLVGAGGIGCELCRSPSSNERYPPTEGNYLQ